MIEHAITGLLLVVALSHFAPIVGFFGNQRLAALYGIEIREGSLEILMRHRAVLFGILGAFFAYAAFVPALQPLAFVGAFLSLASFFYLTATVGDLSPAIRKLVIADVVVTVFLAVAVVLFVIQRGG